MANKYKDIGKKQIIGVIEKLIQKMEAIEVTLNLFIEYADKDEEFDKFMNKKLGEISETQENVQTDRSKDSSDNKENS